LNAAVSKTVMGVFSSIEGSNPSPSAESLFVLGQYRGATAPNEAGRVEAVQLYLLEVGEPVP
jgi:hypothetical protein